MSEQNYSNHRRLVTGWHFVTSILVVALLTGSIVNFVHFNHVTHYTDAMILLAAIIICAYFIFIRLFPLRAQDRAIRAEESLRYYILTGKPLDKQLRMGQIIALRFASDEEFPLLAKRAVDEQLTSKQIKQAIKNWRGDYYRV